MDNIVQAFMYIHPIRTRFLFAAGVCTLLACVAVAVWAHVTDQEPS